MNSGGGRGGADLSLTQVLNLIAPKEQGFSTYLTPYRTWPAPEKLNPLYPTDIYY